MSGPGKRGDPVWAVNRFRSGALVKFVSDLQAMEKSGIREEQCRDVCKTLENIIDKTARYKVSSYWSEQICAELNEFLKIYVEWNNVKGDDVEAVVQRSQKLKELRNRRQKIAEQIRQNQQVFATEIDRSLFDDAFGHLSLLCKEHPTVFARLRTSVDEYHKRCMA